MIPTAKRMEHLKPFYFAARGVHIGALQAAGADIIRLDVGSPDLPPSPAVIEALKQAAAKPDRHGYQPHRGPEALRGAWADYYRRYWGVEIDPQGEILPLLGSKEGIFHLSLAYIQPGDVVLTPDPGYGTYERGPLVAGGELYRMPLLADKNYLPDLSLIPADILARTKILWLNYPNNPTSAVAPFSFFEQVVAFARRHHFLVCHDAAYSRVTFTGAPAPSILQVPGALDVAVEFNTLSKSHNMAGWRSAALVGNREVVQTLFRLKSNADSSHFLPIFEASVVAMGTESSWLEQRNQVYRQRRDAVLHGLKRLGIDADGSQAGMYVWAPVPADWDALEFGDQALERAHVSFTPGVVFGPAGQGYVRIALTETVERIEEAMGRLHNWMEVGK